MNVLPRQQQLFVPHHIVEGSSLRSISRLTGIRRTTIMDLMVKVGRQCRALTDRWMRNLPLDHLEIDEIWTFAQKKQGRVPVGVRDERIGDQYLLIAIDETTKLTPAFLVAKRTKETTDRFIEELAGRLVLSDPFRPGPRPQLSTDGWQAYSDSIEMEFAGRASHGVIIKD